MTDQAGHSFSVAFRKLHETLGHRLRCLGSPSRDVISPLQIESGKDKVDIPYLIAEFKRTSERFSHFWVTISLRVRSRGS